MLILAVVGIFVVLFEVVKAVRVEHVTTVEQSSLFIERESTEADRTFALISLKSCLTNTFPKFIQLLLIIPLSSLCKRSLFLLIHGSLDIWEEGL